MHLLHNLLYLLRFTQALLTHVHPDYILRDKPKESRKKKKNMALVGSQMRMNLSLVPTALLVL